MQEKINRYLSAKRALFDKIYGKRLNPEQCRAVFTSEGPLLVLAGAGSGKTTVLVNRLAYIIRYGDAYHTDLVPTDVNEAMIAEMKAAAGLSHDELGEYLTRFTVNPPPAWQVMAITFTNKGHLPAPLPDTRQRSRATSARSSA